MHMPALGPLLLLGGLLGAEVNAPVPLAAATRIVLLGSDGAPLQYTTNGSSLVMSATLSEHAFVFRVTPGVQ